MSDTTLSAEVMRLLMEAESLEFELSRHVREWELWRGEHPKSDFPDHFIDRDAELRSPFTAALERLYLASVCLIEEKGLREYLKQFYTGVGDRFTAEGAQEFSFVDDLESNPQSSYLMNLRKFLAPFGIISDVDAYRQQAGIRCLETVLANTATLLRQLNVKPTSEPEVYRPVREVVKLIFEGARDPPHGKFSKTLKNYAPDILIPDLYAAVEYKYIPSSTSLKAALAGIADDVVGYTGDTQYRLFYAVFYFSDNFLSQRQFQTFWAEKRFPKEWIPIFVVGS